MHLATVFRENLNQSLQDFQAIANNLKDPYRDMSVGDAELAILRQADAETSALAHTAVEKLPKVEKGFFGITGSKRGHWGAIAMSVVTIGFISVPLILSIVELVKDAQDDRAGVPTTELVTQITSEVLAFITVIYWHIHAKNARKASGYASVNQNDSQAVTHMRQFSEASAEMHRTVNTYLNSTRDDLDEGTCAVNMKRLYTQIDSLYRMLSPAQQEQIGNLTLIKEKYILLLPGGDDGHILRRKLDRMRLCAQALMQTHRAFGSIKQMDIQYNDRASGVESLLDLQSNELDALEGDFNKMDEDLQTIFRTYPRHTKMRMRKDWASLMAYTGYMDSFDTGNYGLRCNFSGKVFNPQSIQNELQIVVEDSPPIPNDSLLAAPNSGYASQDDSAV